jgi:hypothetical protein
MGLVEIDSSRGFFSMALEVPTVGWMSRKVVMQVKCLL